MGPGKFQGVLRPQKGLVGIECRVGPVLRSKRALVDRRAVEYPYRTALVIACDDNDDDDGRRLPPRNEGVSSGLVWVPVSYGSLSHGRVDLRGCNPQRYIRRGEVKQEEGPTQDIYSGSKESLKARRY